MQVLADGDEVFHGGIVSVPTFTPKTNIQQAPYMQADPAGQWVKLSDYQALEAQVAAVENKDAAIKVAADATG
jgi:hypothetical protein